MLRNPVNLLILKIGVLTFIIAGIFYISKKISTLGDPTMKKAINFVLAAFMLLFLACGKESGEVKLLESITQEGQTTKFKYDDKNRIIKIGNTAIAYKGNDVVIIDGTEYKREGNVISSESVETFTLDKDGFIIDPYYYKSANGNLIEWESGGDMAAEYKYDDKKSPFYNTNTPKWVMQYLLTEYLRIQGYSQTTYLSKNNVIEEIESYSNGEVNSKYSQYEYDSDGFPIKRTKTGNGNAEITTFTYRKGKKVEQETETATEQPTAVADNQPAAPKLLYNWTEDDYTRTFFYDNKYRIVKISINDTEKTITTITYSGNDSVTVRVFFRTNINSTKIFVKSGNTITVDKGKEILTVNSDGQIIRQEFFNVSEPYVASYQYQDGNLIKEKSYADFEFKYDDKKSMFNCNTPKWLLRDMFQSYGSKNNVVGFNTNVVKYEYDSDGFPTKMIRNEQDGEYDEKEVISTFTYIGNYEQPAAQQPAKEAFRSVKIGTQKWMAENLNDPSKGGKCYEDKPENCEKYGRLYTWDEAMNACPTGWHLPSKDEWQTLVDFADSAEVAGKKLKAKSGWNKPGNGTDDFGFSALPGGSTNEDGGFSDVGEYGYWWTSTEESGSGSAFVRALGENVSVGFQKWTIYLYSVRCVKD